MLDGPGCTGGVFRSELDCQGRETIASLPHISIMEHSQPSTVLEVALKKRQENNVDPFNSEFFSM